MVVPSAILLTALVSSSVITTVTAAGLQTTVNRTLSVNEPPEPVLPPSLVSMVMVSVPVLLWAVYITVANVALTSANVPTMVNVVVPETAAPPLAVAEKVLPEVFDNVTVILPAPASTSSTDNPDMAVGSP